jgi:hypothetical protein
MDYACYAYANAMQLRTKHLKCYNYLLNRLELAEDDNTKIVELHKYYNFVKWLKDWFGLDCELYGVKVRYIETGIQVFGLRKFSSVGLSFNRLVGHF